MQVYRTSIRGPVPNRGSLGDGSRPTSRLVLFRISADAGSSATDLCPLPPLRPLSRGQTRPACISRPIRDPAGRRVQAALTTVFQQVAPTDRALAIALTQGDQVLLALGIRTDQHHQTGLLRAQARLQVNPVAQDVNVLPLAQIPLFEGCVTAL